MSTTTDRIGKREPRTSIFRLRSTTSRSAFVASQPDIGRDGKKSAAGTFAGVDPAGSTAGRGSEARQSRPQTAAMQIQSCRPDSHDSAPCEHLLLNRRPWLMRS